MPSSLAIKRYRVPPFTGSQFASLFNPLSLSPTFYLDMSRNTDPNDTVYTTMVDSSGNGRNFTTSSMDCLVKTNSQNGLRTLLIPGNAGDYYQRMDSGLITSSAFYIACVGRTNALPPAAGGQYGDPAIFSADTGEFYFGYHNNTPLIGVGGDDGATIYTASRPADTTTFHLWEGFLDSGVLGFSRDRVGSVTDPCPNFILSNTFRIGVNYNLAALANINIGALFICNHVPSGTDLTNLRAYLKSLWGTP